MWKSTGKFEGKNVIGLQYFFLFKGCKRKKNAQTEINTCQASIVKHMKL